MTHQTSFSQAEFADKKKITRREKFLARMEEVIPWAKLLAVIEPFYPKGFFAVFGGASELREAEIQLQAYFTSISRKPPAG